MAQQFLTSINLNSNELQNALLHPLATAPAVGAAGKVYYNTSENTLYISDGSAWRSVSGDITEVIAGNGLTGGGDSGSVTINIGGGDAIGISSDSIAVLYGPGLRINGFNQLEVRVDDESIELDGTNQLSLKNTAVTAGSYGSSTAIPTFTVDADGRLTAAGEAAIQTSFNITDGTTTEVIDGGDTLTFSGTANEIDVTVSATDTVTIGLPDDVTINSQLTVGNSSSSDAPVITSTSSSAAENILLVSTTTSTTSAPDLVLFKDKHPYVDGEVLGKIEFRGNNVNDTGSFAYNQINSRIIDASQQQSALTLASFYGSNTTHGLAVHTLGSNDDDGAVIINAPSETTIPTATLDVRGDINATGDVVVGGNLTVSGTTTTVNTETINLADNIITLNSNATGTPSENAGIEVERGDGDNVSLYFDESADRWKLTYLVGPGIVTTSVIPVEGEYNNYTFFVNGDTGSHPVANGEVLAIVGGDGIETAATTATGVDTVTITHSDTSSVSDVDNSGLTVIQDLTFDGFGHVQTVGSQDITSDVDARIIAREHASTITDTETVNHNLGSLDVIVQLYDSVTLETVFADVVRTDSNNIDVTFASTPTNSIRVLITKIG